MEDLKKRHTHLFTFGKIHLCNAIQETLTLKGRTAEQEERGVGVERPLHCTSWATNRKDKCNWIKLMWAHGSRDAHFVKGLHLH